ncbi:MAG: SUF system Fe-S cluster assembly regulator [Alphaproteobacteria bacterium]|nr:MAG: SUF system Fe-S cluster assembly regulator [Alphaproteobacteria bacterium]
MIRLSQMADYAVVLAGALAERSGEQMNAASLAAATGVPQPTVAKLLNALARAGVLVSRRGVGGGFTLARKPDAITLREVIEAADGPIALVTCLGGTQDNCGIEDLCAMRPHWMLINRTLAEALDSITLADLAHAGGGLDDTGSGRFAAAS